MSSKTLDVYAPCPCGSGKKVKFCCNNTLIELDRVMRLHESQLPEQALAALDRIVAKTGDKPIIPITRAQLLMELGRFDETAAMMRDFLKSYPDNGHATALLAFARFMDVGFFEARPEIHRAFQVCPQSSPDTIASLAAEIAGQVYAISWMSAREHLALALRLTHDQQERQHLFQELMRLDSSPNTPYPLRGTHALTPVDGPEETRKDLRNAVRLSILGCWEIAAKLFLKVSEQLPDNWALWKNIGLCRAWDAEPQAAAEALHKAAALCPVYEDAVECETIAQLLDYRTVEEVEEHKAARFQVRALSKALSVLDDCGRLSRRNIPVEDDDQMPRMVAEYFILDRAVPTGTEPVPEEQAPLVVGRLAVLELQAEQRKIPIVSVTPVTLADHAQNIALVKELLGGELETTDLGDLVEGESYGEAPFEAVPVELLQWQYRRFLGRATPLRKQRQLAGAHCRNFIREVWSNTPLKRLDGRTPRDAGNDPALKIRLAAAIHTLEAMRDLSNAQDELAALRQSLNVEPEKPVEVSDDLPLNAMSVMESHRLPLEKLSDDQLAHFVNRAMLVNHPPFTYAVLHEVERRPNREVLSPDRATFLRSIVSVCRALERDAEALEWCRKGRDEFSKAGDFSQTFMMTALEFGIRRENPEDAELPALIDHLWNYYGEKVPNFRDRLAEMLHESGLPMPGQTAGGIVLPGAETTPTAAGASRLWIPE